MFRRVVLILAALLTVVGLGWAIPTSPASAAPAAPAQSVDYGNVCVITVTPPNPRAGGRAVVHGTDFPPNTMQPIILDGTTQIGTANVNPAGIFNEPVTIPASAGPGPHTISVFCETTGVSSTTTFNISASTTPVSSGGGGSGTTAKTGSDTEPKIVLGLSVIVVGLGLVMAARRRRRRFAIP